MPSSASNLAACGQASVAGLIASEDGVGDVIGVLTDIEMPRMFSEIGVYRQQNPVFRSGACEQCLIPRIGSELAGLEDVMILGTQPVGQLWAGTAIDEELHGSATEMADSVS